MTDSLRERIARAVNMAEGCVAPERFPCAVCEKSDGCLKVADAALAAIEASGTHAVVPLEPTEEMWRSIEPAGPTVVGGSAADQRYEGARQDYRAMLAARPR